jgi:hypothetical protein
MKHRLGKRSGKLFVKPADSIDLTPVEISWEKALERFPDQLFDLIFAGDADMGRFPATLRASQLRPKDYVRKHLAAIPFEDRAAMLADDWDKPAPPL